LSGIIGLLKEGCCCGCSTTGAAMYTSIAALPSSTWTCNLSGTFELDCVSTAEAIDGLYECSEFTCPPGCWHIPSLLPRINFLDYPVLLGWGQPRIENKYKRISYCPRCEPATSIDLIECVGLESESFTSNGVLVGSYAPTGFGSPCGLGAAGIGLSTTILFSGGTSTTVSGVTQIIGKSLRVHKTTVPTTCYPFCLALDFRMSVRIRKSFTGGILCSGQDEGRQSAQYTSAWNGTDTQSQFLSRLAKCVKFGWTFAPCLNGRYMYSSGAADCSELDQIGNEPCPPGGPLYDDQILLKNNLTYETYQSIDACCPTFVTEADISAHAPWQTTAGFPLTIQLN